MRADGSAVTDMRIEFIVDVPGQENAVGPRADPPQQHRDVLQCLFEQAYSASLHWQVDRPEQEPTRAQAHEVAPTSAL